jgi:hypothetical protein
MTGRQLREGIYSIWGRWFFTKEMKFKLRLAVLIEVENHEEEESTF